MKKMLTKSLKGKDFISLMDYSREELETILEVAIDCNDPIRRACSIPYSRGNADCPSRNLDRYSQGAGQVY